jgi:hypothetical protein
MVFAIIFEWDLDAQWKMFKLMMKSNVAQVMTKVSTLNTDKVNP